MKKWSVNETTKRFKALCMAAFTSREMTGVPFFGALSSLYHGSVYKTQPLEKALKSYFGDQPFFGGGRKQQEEPNRVVVTSTTALEQKPVVFANYNRPDQADQGKNSS
jgi:hypothetical protein